MKKIVILFFVLAAAMAAGVVCWRLWEGHLHAAPVHEPASRTRFLDPYTRVYQTDDPDEGRRLAAEPGYWSVPHEVRFRVFRGFAITSNDAFLLT